MSGRLQWHVRLLTFILFALMAPSVNAQSSQLGKVEFQTTGSAESQTHFLRGLAALHSFWYEEALEAFRDSTKAEPDFMMGYWGEAMAFNHPLWSEQDTAAARLVVAKIKDSPRLTPRERAYLNAVKLLYGEGDKGARDSAYSGAMEKIFREYTDDLDAAAFYSLSLLGLVDIHEKSYRLQAKAGAIAMDVYQKNPNHPGAAHYIIHAFDDPDHAILALPAARRYAGIAPEAHHARHMPSHIFLQLGMWREAAASNESAWESSVAWMKRKNLSPSVRDFHSLHWLLYVYLQQGRYNEAEELLAMMRKVMTESRYENKLRPEFYENNYANMAAAFVVETERWNLASVLFDSTKSQRTNPREQPTTGGHAGHDAAPATSASSQATVRASNKNLMLPLFIRGMAAANNNGVEAKQILVRLKSLISGADANKIMALQISELEIEAVAASKKKNYAKAIEFMKRATFLEEEMGPPSGPPGLIKPSNELFGEILLRAGKPVQAAEQFRMTLLRQPNRARTLLGLARAEAQSGNRLHAANAYAQLLDQWQHADKELPELREAQEFVKQRNR